MRDERKRDARERTPSRTRYLASSARVRWNAPYGRWRRAVTNQSIRLAVHSAKMAVRLTADLWGYYRNCITSCLSVRRLHKYELGAKTAGLR